MIFKFLSFFKEQLSVQQICRHQNPVNKQPTTFLNFVAMASHGLSPSTVDNYLTAIRSFIKFQEGKDLPLSLITADIVRQYELWLQKENIRPNTSSCYMRSLRAIYNKAVRRRRIKNRHPFCRAFTGNDKTTKRSIGKDDILKIRGLQVAEKDVSLEFSRNLFLFSFYAMGMPFVDMAHLKKNQIKNGWLTYRRRKTGKIIRVHIESCMTVILEKYANMGGEYVFPIISSKSITDAQRHHNVSLKLAKYNRDLKKIAKDAGISVSLSSYVARHSWASIAYKESVDLPIISKALGHTDTATTRIYISEIDDERVEKANKWVLFSILSSPLAKR